MDNISNLTVTRNEKALLLHKLCFQHLDKKVVSSVAKSNHHQKKQLPLVVANATELENEIYLREKYEPVNNNSVLDKETNAINNGRESYEKADISNNDNNKKVCNQDGKDCK